MCFTIQYLWNSLDTDHHSGFTVAGPLYTISANIGVTDRWFLPYDVVLHPILLVTVGLLKQSSYLFLRVYAASVAVFYANALGMLMEVLQVLTTDRHMEAMDVLFNGIGSMLGFIVFYLVYKY